MAAMKTHCNLLWDLHLKRAVTMALALIKLGCVISSESIQVIVVAALAIEAAIVFVTVAVCDFDRVISSDSTQVIVVAALAIEAAIVLITTAVPDFGCALLSSATSLGRTVWDQLSTPSPPMPAGDITLRLIRIWLNHAIEVELPQLSGLAGIRLKWPVVDNCNRAGIRGHYLCAFGVFSKRKEKINKP
jgi:hypothetical protein